MEIKVSEHAVKQYRKKMFDYSSSDAEIIETLAEIAKKGKIICPRPSVKKPTYDVRYSDLSVVAEITKKTTTIITFLGDSVYRKWAQKDIAIRYTKVAI